MPVQPIRLFGDPVLRSAASPVTDFDKELQRLVSDLTDTMLNAPGAGLAAPQIGVDLRLVIFGYQKNLRYPDAPPVPETVLLNISVTDPDPAVLHAFMTMYEEMSHAAP